MTCLKTMVEARKEASGTLRPLRFIYFSGALAERDQTRTPRFMPEHMLMRVSFDLRLVSRISIATNVMKGRR